MGRDTTAQLKTMRSVAVGAWQDAWGGGATKPGGSAAHAIRTPTQACAMRFALTRLGTREELFCVRAKKYTTKNAPTLMHQN